RRRLAPAWQQAQARNAATQPQDDAMQAAECWLVEAELDAGLDSPASAHALRREIQMQRLAIRLRGDSGATVDARERLLQWAGLAPVPPQHYATLQPRLQALLQRWTTA